MTRDQKEGCIWLTVGGLLGFLFVVFVTVRVIALAWRW